MTLARKPLCRGDSQSVNTMGERTTVVGQERANSGWGSLEHQQIFSYYTIDPDDIERSRNVYVLEQARTVEPLNGELAPDEVAELVSLDISLLKAHIEPTGNEMPDPGLVMIEAELSFNPESVIEAATKPQIDTMGGEAFETNTAYGQTVNPGPHVSLQGLNELSPDVIWFGESRNYTPFKDEAAGIGGAPTAEGSQNRYFRNFRAEYGEGPIIDADANLFEHIFINAGTTHNVVEHQAFEGILGYTLTWDVHNVEAESCDTAASE